MNAKQLIASAMFTTFAFAGTAALANDANIAADNFVATKTRAEVQAEVISARAAGLLPMGIESEVGVAQPAAHSAVSRDVVRAELLAARSAGQSTVGIESEVGVVQPAVTASNVSRQQVRAEGLMAQRNRVAVYDPAG